jgi:long-chain fatty acid transport protein
MRVRVGAVVLGVVLVAGMTRPALATDGHFLHGVGAINSAMGGVGVASPVSLMGTFYHNPAGLMAFNDGIRFEFGFELFKPSRTLSSAIAGGPSGATDSKSDFSTVPAMAFSVPIAGGKAVVGLGGIAISGFGVDYPADPANPILSPRPNGFGQVYSSYGLLKLTPAVAFAPVEGVWIGAAANINWASLAVDPFPIAAPAADPSGAVYYSRATAADGAFGFGFQVGAMVMPVEKVAIGAAYSSAGYFDEFTYNGVYENPNLPNFQQPRVMTFRLDLPAVMAGGLSFRPMPNLLVGGDVRYYFYESAEGFKVDDYDPANPGTIFNADGSVKGFGWENIFSFAGGLEFVPTPKLAVYAGYNYAQNPVPDQLAMVNVPAPAIVQNHLSGGLGLRLLPELEITLAYYRVLENSGTGPILNPNVPQGSTVTNTMDEQSFLVQFSFSPGGMR